MHPFLFFGFRFTSEGIRREVESANDSPFIGGRKALSCPRRGPIAETKKKIEHRLRSNASREGD